MKKPLNANHDFLRTASGGAGVLALAFASAVCAQDPAYTEIKSYVVPVTTDYAVQPLLSVGDQVANTSDPTKVYQMIGIPDGLGAHRGPGDSTILYMNDELTETTTSEPNVGAQRNRGAIVSRWVLDEKGAVVSGRRAYARSMTRRTARSCRPRRSATRPRDSRVCARVRRTRRPDSIARFTWRVRNRLVQRRLMARADFPLQSSTMKSTHL